MVAERVDVHTAREMLRAGDTVVDVRTPAEYAAGHISGAVNIPIEQISLDTLPPGQLLTACSQGGRAGRVGDMLASAGRTVFVIDGGTKAWEAAGLPVERGPAL